MAELIWTKHALQRVSERGFPKQLVHETFSTPDKIFNGRERGTREYQKFFGPSRVTVIAKQNDKNEWVILSCWIDPPLPGTEDHRKLRKYKEYKEATGLKKWWLAIKRQLGF